MNILFTTSAAPLMSPFFTNEKSPPLGLGFLISLMRAAGHKIFFIDNYLTPSNFIKEGYLQKNNIDVVGIYANTICFRDTLRMLGEIEELREKGMWCGKVIVGGPHTSVATDTIPEYVDHIVQGEGENAIIDIINGKEKRRLISNKNNRMKDLDFLPFQPWDIFSRLPYDFSCLWMDVKPVFTMNTSRGCPFHCNFCSVNSIWGDHCTFFSADRIISEIEYLVKIYGAKGIYFREDNFTLNIKRTEEFCKKMIKGNFRIPWACETRVDSLCDEEIVELMAHAGCKAVYLGVESGSQKILDILNKKITVEQIEKAISLCKKYQIRTYCSLLVGVPGETYEDYLLTQKRMKQIKPFRYVFNVFVAIPYSPLYRSILENNQYEYMDDLGLLYLPGYDVKAKFFYDIESKNLVEYEFKQRTSFDLMMLKKLRKREMRRKILGFLTFILPDSIKKNFGETLVPYGK